MPVTEHTTRTYTCDRCGKKENWDSDGRAVKQGWDNVIINGHDALWLCQYDRKLLQEFLIGEASR